MKITRYFILLFFTFFVSQVYSQNSFKAIVKDKISGATLPGVVVVEKNGKGNTTDNNGKVIIEGLTAGSHSFIASYTGYTSDTVVAVLPDTSWRTILLSAQENNIDEVTIVASTRTNERIENAPVKVEVLAKDDLDEENTIRPANIASILGDVSGIQVQQSSAVSGDVNIRIQGLGGRYTQLLRDGMPLFDGFSGGLSILQIPPLDLKQVELIKGSASTLYGGGAIGGLINLISNTPPDSQAGVITLNQTTLKETDVNAYAAKRYKKFGYTLLASYIHQDAVDVNKDGFSDVPQIRTFVIHPKLFYYPDDKTSLSIGYNGTFDNRKGGDMQVLNGHSDSLHQYYENDISQRHTGELDFERSLPGLIKLTIKGSVSSLTRDIQSSLDDIKGNQVNYYSEISLFIPQGENSWVAGVNITGMNFKKLPSDTIALNDFYNNTAGAFVQYAVHLPLKISAEAGLRFDHDDHYGNFFLPHVALFHRFNDVWGIRAGAGLGYKIPNPLEVQDIDYPVEDILPLPQNIKAERSTGYNLEGNFRKDFSNDVTLFINQAFFLTQINNPIVATQYLDDSVIFNNETKPVVTKGFDTYAKLKIKGIELYAGYTYSDVERTYLSQNQFMPLTPRNRLAFTALKEIQEKWRFGIEGSDIGTQYRYDGTKTPSYFLMSVMIARNFGKKFTLVLNCENLLNVKQSNYETLYTGPVTNPVFNPLWAPIDGRVINLSLRISPFAR